MRTESLMPIKVVNGVRMVGVGVGFERVRRITGYLVGTTDRFNNAKRAEVNDRLTHSGRLLSCDCYEWEAA